MNTPGTEEDTFRALKKATFEQMGRIFVEIALRYRMVGSTDYEAWAAEREHEAEKNGWTVRKWQKENIRRAQLK